MMVNPPLNLVGKSAYEGVLASIANSLNFKRFLTYNPTICFSQNLLFQVFQDTHRHGEKVFWRSGEKLTQNF